MLKGPNPVQNDMMIRQLQNELTMLKQTQMMQSQLPPSQMTFNPQPQYM